MTHSKPNWLLECPALEEFIPDPRGVGATFFDNLKKHGQNVAQIHVETGETTTYAEILLQTICVAQEMSARGITSDDTISLCTHQHMTSNIPIVAATYLLAKVASLDPAQSLGEMKHVLNLVKPRMIFVSKESEDVIENAMREIDLECEIIVFGETEAHVPFKEFLVQRGNESNFKPKYVKNLFETAFIFFSSGSTGLPKGACLHHYHLLYVANLYSISSVAKISLSLRSSYWTVHLIFFMATVSLGKCSLVCNSFDETDIFQIIEKYQVTDIFLPPPLTYAITLNPNYHKYDRSSLKEFYSGGSTISESQISAIEKVFPNAIVAFGYGSTECGIITCFSPTLDIDLIKSKRRSCGKLAPGMSCKIVDPETEEILGPNQPGELLVKTKILMNGYYNNPEETKNSFDKDGYFRTGDIAYFDEDQCFYVIDRIKEMFKYRTWHILPAELENILLAHPAIQEAIIIGYPHEVDGDRPMALVVLKENANISETEIVDFFNAKVPDRKALRAGVRFVTNIERTVTGKYNRRIMRNMIISNKINEQK